MELFAMRSLALPLALLLAGCAHPASRPAAPTPMASACPMMHGGATHPMAGMAMAAPSDSGAAHGRPCPMHDRMHPMAHDSSGAAHAIADSTHAMAGCPMCASGGCPMHPPADPAARPHAH